MRNVAALFVRADSIYKAMPGVDAWDAERDARTWPGGCPVVAHPPCRAWSQLSHFAKPRPDERELAPWAVEQVRRWGGVLEHPAGSKLWPELGLPKPGTYDQWGGWTLAAPQQWWGHRADKPTRFYIVGILPQGTPAIPFVMGEPSCVISHMGGPRRGEPGHKPELGKKGRESTPPLLAQWLVDLARRTRVLAEVA